MTTFVLAPDSFKHSLTAQEVCNAMEKGIRVKFPGAHFIHIPMADGGEGTVQSLVDATGGRIEKIEVQDPLGRSVMASIGISGDGTTGFIEMSSASGIMLISEKERDPLSASTYGTGQLIKACLEKGIRRIIIGIGGSATNDGGAGMAVALGARLLDREGKSIPSGGGGLSMLNSINIDDLDERLKDTEIFVACDVTNPLCGARGASAVYGPQKGATPEMVGILDRNLAIYADVIKRQLGKDVKDIPGAGAAGGLGAGLLAFTNATLKRGIDIVVEYTGLEEKIKGADYVFTGEGSIDQQTKYGKTPLGAARIGKKYGKTVIAIAGNIGEGIEKLYEEWITAIFGILPCVTDLEHAIMHASENVERTCMNIAGLLK